MSDLKSPSIGLDSNVKAADRSVFSMNTPAGASLMEVEFGGDVNSPFVPGMFVVFNIILNASLSHLHQHWTCPTTSGVPGVPGTPTFCLKAKSALIMANFQIGTSLFL